MNISVQKVGQGREASTTLSWRWSGGNVSLEFETIARPVFSEVVEKIYVSEYLKSSIYIFAKSGELVRTIEIPTIDGYQYRGLNKNKKSKNGIALLYVPVDEGRGNEWRDIEQYELNDESPNLGSFLDIYR